jgi:hypothetical protein
VSYIENNSLNMETDKIEVLQKSKISRKEKPKETSSGCCGGAPTNNSDACCKLDEEKKAEGETGCGCNTDTSATASKCCG